MQKFVEVKRGAGSVNSWFEKCRNEQIPYIVVNKSNKYASVRWDYINLSDGKVKLLKKNHALHLKRIEYIFSYYEKPGVSGAKIGALLIDFEKVENEKANDLACDLFDVIKDMIKD